MEVPGADGGDPVNETHITGGTITSVVISSTVAESPATFATASGLTIDWATVGHLLDDEHHFEPYDGGAGLFALFGTDTWTGDAFDADALSEYEAMLPDEMASSDGESGNSLSETQEQLIAEIFGAIEEEYLEDDAVITLSEVDGEDQVAFIEQGYYMALRGNMTHDGSSPVTAVGGTISSIAVAMAVADLVDDTIITPGDSILTVDLGADDVVDWAEVHTILDIT